VDAPASPNMGFEFLPKLDLMVLVQLEKSPTDAEWDAYLQAIAEPLRRNLLRCVVITEGASPTREQQGRMNALMKGQLVLVAVVSPSTGVRFVVSVLALVNRAIKSYSPRDYEAAFSHLGLAVAERVSVAESIDRVRLRLISADRGTSRLRRWSSAPGPNTR
jgi:hypothetical protein